MSYKPPSPERTRRDAKIVRLYKTITAPEIAARLDTSLHVVKAVVKREGLVKGRGKRRMKPGPVVLRTGPVEDLEHAAFLKRTARSSDALLESLRQHPPETACELRMKPGRLPRPMSADPSGSMLGSPGALCTEHAGRL